MGGKAVGPEVGVQPREDPTFSPLGEVLLIQIVQVCGSTDSRDQGRMGLEQAVGTPGNQWSSNQEHLPLGHLGFSGAMGV